MTSAHETRNFAVVLAMLRRAEWRDAERECRRMLGSDAKNVVVRLILAALHVAQESGAEASRFLDDLLPRTRSADIRLEIVEAVLRLAGSDVALASLAPMVAHAPDASPIMFCLGKLQLRRGNLAEADSAFRAFQQQEPGIARLLREMPPRTPDRSALEQALERHRGFLTLGSDIRDTFCNDALVLLAMGNGERAIASLMEMIRLDACARPVRTLVKVLELMGRSEDTKQWARRALDWFDDQPEVIAEFATTLIKHGDWLAAETCLRRQLARHTNHIMLLDGLARIESSPRATRATRATRANHERAIDLLRQQAPHALITCIAVGRHLALAKDYNGAIAVYEMGMQTHFQPAELYEPLGKALLAVGKLEEAAALLSRAACFSADAWATLVGFQAVTKVLDSHERMNVLSQNPLLSIVARTRLNFALARLHDSRGEFNLAYRHLESANRAVAKMLPSAHAQHAFQVERAVAHFSVQAFDRLPRAEAATMQPIFVCGLPRSGTTLTEQVLASHPAVEGVGELRDMRLICGRFRELAGSRGTESIFDPAAVRAAATDYLSRLRLLAPEAKFVIDKTNSNYLYLGLIATMFPNAKIIHVKRNHRDVALSLYFADFQFMWNGPDKRRPPLEYSFDIDAIAHVIREYSRIMAHWRTNLPIAFHEIWYEDLVTDFERAAKDLFSFIGLEWRSEALAFYRNERVVDNSNAWNVRLPLYRSSIGKWRNYQQYLPALEEIL